MNTFLLYLQFFLPLKSLPPLLWCLTSYSSLTPPRIMPLLIAKPTFYRSTWPRNFVWVVWLICIFLPFHWWPAWRLVHNWSNRGRLVGFNPFILARQWGNHLLICNHIGTLSIACMHIILKPLQVLINCCNTMFTWDSYQIPNSTSTTLSCKVNHMSLILIINIIYIATWWNSKK